ncbi:MAG TPA: NADP-dependent oxidoreductase [Ktedonobacterales bacterium]|nr:NADP-dependent oxidoreductase [Ktedonobacterales bacterium]
MQAIQVHQFGGPEQLKLEQTECPQPQAGAVLVRIHAAGVLPADWKLRRGLFKDIVPVSFPYIPGSAFAGIVEEVGADVADVRFGQAVFGRSSTGAYAEYVTASVETLALKPDRLSFDEAATISGGATIAWTALFDRANGDFQPGQRVLIHGAAGGVGLFAVQFARWKGAHVIATASAGNLEFVRTLGAETVIDYAATPFEREARDVDLVLDTIGGETLHRSMNVVRPGGIVVSLLEQPSQEDAKKRGIRAVKNSATLPYPSRDLLQTIAQLMDEGQVKTVVGKTFPLPEAHLAHELSECGHGRGRIVLHIADA